MALAIKARNSCIRQSISGNQGAQGAEASLQGVPHSPLSESLSYLGALSLHHARFALVILDLANNDKALLPML